MTTQLPEAIHENLCPHCDNWPLSEDRDVGNELVYSCSSCGCEFSAADMSITIAGDHCPVAGELGTV